MTTKNELKQHAKADRPPLFPDEPAAEKILSMVMALATEVAVLRERLDTIEKVAGQKGFVTADDIENFSPDEAVAAERRNWRNEYIERVYHVMLDDIDLLSD